MGSFYRKQLEEFLSHLEIDAENVLDIGGLQLPIKSRVAKWKAKNYKIMDVIEKMGEEKADFVADISRSLDYHKEINDLDETFDIVFCLEVMEYVFDPLQALENIKRFLKKGGIAYVSFPFVYPIHPPLDTDLLRYTQHGVEKLVKEAGLREVNTYVRRASAGRFALKRFYDEEAMKYRRDDLSFLDHIGYIVKLTTV